MKINMKIVTVNLPQNILNAIESLIGENGLYPSRSELVRVAIREYLIQEIESAKSFKKYMEHKEKLKFAKLEEELEENEIIVDGQIYQLIEQNKKG